MPDLGRCRHSCRRCWGQARRQATQHCRVTEASSVTCARDIRCITIEDKRSIGTLSSRLATKNPHPRDHGTVWHPKNVHNTKLCCYRYIALDRVKGCVHDLTNERTWTFFHKLLDLVYDFYRFTPRPRVLC